jgi:hypothetical protein
MTSKEKAQQIVDKYKLISIMSNTDAGEEILCTLISKQCALIAVDFIWQSLEHERIFEMWDYWKEVKQEIEKL